MGRLVGSRVVSWFQGLQGAQQIFLAPDVFELDSKFIILCNQTFLKDHFCLLRLGLHFLSLGLVELISHRQLMRFRNKATSLYE